MLNLNAFVVGLLFGLGLIISGMTDPSKVIGFLDLAGAWDPSLGIRHGRRHSGWRCCLFYRQKTSAQLVGSAHAVVLCKRAG